MSEQKENLTVPVVLVEEKNNVRKKHGYLWQITKWTVISISGLFGVGAAVGGGVVYYYSRPAEVDGQDVQSMAKSEEELLAILREEFGYDVQIIEKFAREDYEVEEMELGLKPMAKRVAIKICIKAHSLWNDPEETGEDLKKNAGEVAEYVTAYQMSEDQMTETDPDRFDCNDFAFRGCQRLQRHGIPMYFLNICPRDPNMRFDKASHQVSFCKLREGEYLFCDNDNLIIWHGTLDQFAAQYYIDNPKKEAMGKFPFFAISKFVEPEHNNSFSKGLIQALNVESEEEIQSLDIPERDAQGKLAGLL